jgi:hypothetical protein
MKMKDSLPAKSGTSTEGVSLLMSDFAASNQSSERMETSELPISSSSPNESDASLTMIRNHSKCVTNHSKPTSSATYVFDSNCKKEAVELCASVETAQKKGKKRRKRENGRKRER